MNTLLSFVSGHVGKALVLSTLLPVIVFVIMARIFAVPLLPDDLQSLIAFEALDPEWQLAATTFATLVLTGLLFNLNIPIIRFYEGYPWKESWIGRWKVGRAQARFDALQARWTGMRTLLYAKEPPAGLPTRSTIVTRWRKIGLEVNRQFPHDRDLVLPTRLGNLIRSFEVYPDIQYGMESIALWPRLVAVLDKDYAASIDDAKSSFDFMLNCGVLSAVTSAAILLSGLLRPIPLSVPGRGLLWLLEVAGFAALSYLFYLFSMGCAAAWGDTVKSAFDLYRGALLRQLGYPQTPATRVEERQLWDDISLQILYGDSPRVLLPSYRSCALSARGEPAYVPLETCRGVQHVSGRTPEELIVTIRVTNANPKGRPAADVQVTDTIPDGFDYLWDTAEVGGHKVAVSGSNPHRFAIGEIGFGHSVDLTYHAVARSKG